MYIYESELVKYPFRKTGTTQRSEKGGFFAVTVLFCSMFVRHLEFTLICFYTCRSCLISYLKALSYWVSYLKCPPEQLAGCRLISMYVSTSAAWMRRAHWPELQASITIQTCPEKQSSDHLSLIKWTPFCLCSQIVCLFHKTERTGNKHLILAHFAFLTTHRSQWSCNSLVSQNYLNRKQAEPLQFSPCQILSVGKANLIYSLSPIESGLQRSCGALGWIYSLLDKL